MSRGRSWATELGPITAKGSLDLPDGYCYIPERGLLDRRGNEVAIYGTARDSIRVAAYKHAYELEKAISELNEEMESKRERGRSYLAHRRDRHDA